MADFERLARLHSGIMTTTAPALVERDAFICQLVQKKLSQTNRDFLLKSEWEDIAKQTDMSSARLCRERYDQLLSPKLNKEPFTKEENALLLEKVQKLGTRWSSFLIYFKNRSATQLKRQYQKLQREKRKEDNSTLLAAFIAKQPKHDEAPNKPLPLPQIFFRPSSNEPARVPSEDGPEHVPFIVPVPEEEPIDDFDAEYEYLKQQWDREMAAMDDPNWQYLPPLVDF